MKAAAFAFCCACVAAAAAQTPTDYFDREGRKRGRGIWSIGAGATGLFASPRRPPAELTVPPAVCGHFFSSDDDMQRTVRGVRWMRQMAAQPALRALIVDEADPGPGVQSDDALADWVRASAVTVYHPVGTCRMGGDDRAVLDPALRVRGAAGLRVVDASVMPQIVSGNTNAPTLMIAEKAAEMILADHA